MAKWAPRITVNPIKLETGLRPNGAGIPYTLLLRIEAMGFPTFRLLLYVVLDPAKTPETRAVVWTCETSDADPVQHLMGGFRV